MKPLVILGTDSQEPSGVGEHMLTLGAALRDHYDIVFLCPPNQAGQALLTRAAQAGLRVRQLPEDPMELRRWLAACGARILHVHAGIGWEGHGLVRAGSAAGLAVVRTEHLPYLLTGVVQQAAHRAMLMHVDHLITVSHASALSYAARNFSIPASTVQNGIVPRQPEVDRAVTRAALGIADDSPLLLTIARLTPQKGHATLIAAVPSILAEYPEAVSVFVGSGLEEQGLRELVTQSGLESAVQLLGHRTDIVDLLAAADLLVLPSSFEGLPLVLLEAMSAGVPVVATRVGGIVEAVGSEHPYLVPPGEAPALADAVLAALRDPESARLAASALRETFAPRFHASRMADEMRAIYASLPPNSVKAPHP